MFGIEGVGIIFLAIAASIVIRASSRAASEIARVRSARRTKGTNGEGVERIEALEERLRLLEERQDFTDNLLSGRHEPRLETPDATPSDRSTDRGADPAG